MGEEIEYRAFKNHFKLSDCAFSLVDLPKGMSVADLVQQRRDCLICAMGLFG